MSGETRDAIAVILILLAALDLAVTLVLVRASRILNVAALTDRATAAVILTCVAWIGALTGIMVSIDTTHQQPHPMIAIAFVLVSVPQLVWWLSYRLGRFR